MKPPIVPADIIEHCEAVLERSWRDARAWADKSGPDALISFADTLGFPLGAKAALEAIELQSPEHLASVVNMAKITCVQLLLEAMKKDMG